MGNITEKIRQAERVIALLERCSKGGKASAAKLTKAERQERARNAGKASWEKRHASGFDMRTLGGRGHKTRKADVTA